jgi:protein O-mannosyl-transferase
MRLKTWHCLVLLALAVLAAYYPSLYAGYNSIDDLKMISSIDQSGPLDLGRLFLPHGTSYYYRPLTILSYIIDRDVWGSIASFMHLENILLHLFSAFLVFAITRRLLPLWEEKGQWPALFAGLFFALHPLGTESVCWISGRTDPLMALFLLLSVWLTVIALSTRRTMLAVAGGVSLLLSCLAKEVAVFVLPGLLWLIVIYPGRGGFLDRLRRRWLTLLMPITGVAGYFILRRFASASDSGVNTAFNGMAGGDYDLWNKLRIAFKVYGFYFKKLLIPWPLNFGIIEISGWYVLSGIVLAIVLLYLVWRADVPGAFGLMAFFVLSPALLVVFGKMTWTPLAERYLYSSVALFAPAAACFFARLKAINSSWAQQRWNFAVAAMLLAFFGTTIHRAWVWQDNLRLYQDTVAGSPDFDAAKSELASALLHKGRVAEAHVILTNMQKESSSSDFINDDMNLAGMFLIKGDLEGARRILLPLLNKNPKKRFDVLQYLIRTNDQRLVETFDPLAKTAIQKESLGWLLEQQRIRPQPFTLYRIGKRYLALGENVRALESFEQAYAQTPGDAFYREPAAKFIRQLQGP